MIEAKDFVEAARKLGFIRYTGVPCSFLTPFINYVINDNSLVYISSSNEGDALATTSGSVIGGQRSIVMMQNSGLGVVLARENFSSPLVAIPAALSSLIHSLLGSFFVVLFKNKN